MHTMLQALAASLAATSREPAAPASASHAMTSQALQVATSKMQDAACGTDATACRDTAAGEASNEAASQTRPAASGGTAATQPTGSSGHACGGGSCSGPDDMLAAAVQRGAKWKARCKELRRALAASREAAALCSSLQVWAHITSPLATVGMQCCKHSRLQNAGFTTVTIPHAPMAPCPLDDKMCQPCRSACKQLRRPHEQTPRPLPHRLRSWRQPLQLRRQLHRQASSR